MKAVQYFTAEYLERCRELSPNEIARFLDEFRRVHGQAKSRSKLISMKVPEDLLSAFRTRANLEGIPYQTKIKRLMFDWLEDSGTPNE